MLTSRKRALFARSHSAHSPLTSRDAPRTSRASIKKVDWIDAGEKLLQFLHGCVAELAYVGPGNLQSHNSAMEFLYCEQAMNAVEMFFS